MSLFNRNKNYVRLICTSRWQQLRHRKIKANPLCEDCLAKGVYRSADEVHHIIPVTSIQDRDKQEALLMDYSNLVSLCRECHVKRHVELGKQTKSETVKRHREETEVFIARFFGKEGG